MLEHFTTETFAARVGETFQFFPDGAVGVPTRLVEVTPLGGSATGSAVGAGPVGRGQAFSLVFRTARDVRVPQRIYRLEHPALGTFELFLVPIGPDAEGMRYEAVFT